MTRRRMIVLPHGHESPHLLHTGGNDWRKHGAVFIRVVDVFLTSESFWGPIVVSFPIAFKYFLFIAFLTNFCDEVDDMSVMAKNYL